MSKTTVAIRVDKDVQERFKVLGEKLDRSPHYLMKAAVERYLEQEEAEQSEIEILKERWTEYELTGISIPGEEITAWIESLPE
jgi:predicted transcriptional regulator